MQKKSVEDFQDKEIEEISQEKPELGDESSWSKDQIERSYYYDDSTGYQKYDPDKDDEDDDEFEED